MPVSGKSWTYALVTPDALVTESLPWLLDTFRSARLEPVVARLIRLDAPTMLRLYDTPARTRPAALPPERAFQLWYDLGPGCLVLLHHDGPDACAVMNHLKGTTDPSTARPGSIRHAGENVLMNLVHCPDDERAAVDELDELVGKKCAGDLQRLATVPDERVRSLTVDSIKDSQPVLSGSTALSLPLIVNRIRLRIVQNLAVAGVFLHGALPLLEKSTSALAKERDDVVHLATSPERTSAARAHNGRLHALLHDAAHAAQDQAAADALSQLSALLMGSPVDWRLTLAAIRTSSTYLSGVESAVLEQSTYI